MTFEEEMDAFMKARIEQSRGWNEMHARGDNLVTTDDLFKVVTHTVGVHREAILRLAREIDRLAPRE